jgi:hypothetical protein
MEHMKDIDLENAGNALVMLSARTVDILANEPGRVLGKAVNEASPASELWGKFTKPPIEPPTD